MSATLTIRQTSGAHRLDWPHGPFGDIAVLVFVLVQCLDGAFTYLGVHTWGLSIEANPLVSSALSFAGVGTGLAATKLFAVGLGVMLHLRRVHLVVALLSLFYIAVAILPWTVMFLTLQ
ncbi:MAG: DUF5658 family protein [Vicinamibacterales bacterium]